MFRTSLNESSYFRVSDITSIPRITRTHTQDGCGGSRSQQQYMIALFILEIWGEMVLCWVNKFTPEVPLVSVILLILELNGVGL